MQRAEHVYDGGIHCEFPSMALCIYCDMSRFNTPTPPNPPAPEWRENYMYFCVPHAASGAVPVISSDGLSPDKIVTPKRLHEFFGHEYPDISSQ